VFVGSGTTANEFALMIPAGKDIRVFTISVSAAAHIAANNVAPVDLPGGAVLPYSLAIDMVFSDELIDKLYWEYGFLGVSAIDIERGITTVEPRMADIERKLMEHVSKPIVLCDSSKLGEFAYAQVGPVTLIHTLITDNGAPSAFVDELIARGVEVVIAEPEEA